MSINNHKASEVYRYFLNDCPHPDYTPAVLARTADRRAGEFVTECRSEGIICPGDDRMMNLELSMFRMLCKAAKIDINELYEVVIP